MKNVIKPDKKRLLIIAAVTCICFFVLSYFFVPMGTHYDGWPKVSVKLLNCDPGSISEIRYFEPSLLGQKCSTAELWEYGDTLKWSNDMCVEIKAWCGGRKNVFRKTYSQSTDGVLLLKMKNGSLKRVDFSFPDFRQPGESELSIQVPE